MESRRWLANDFPQTKAFAELSPQYVAVRVMGVVADDTNLVDTNRVAEVIIDVAALD